MPAADRDGDPARAARRPRVLRAASTPRCRSTARTHSLFGVSKAAADLMVQEYGRYFDMPTVCFRGGCLTGPAHAGAKLHGFLAYLMRCTVTGDAVHDLRLRGQAGPRQHPRRRRGRARSRRSTGPHARPPSTTSAAGGGRNCSMLEAIDACERISGRELEWTMVRRAADRRPPLVDLRPRRLQADYPDWQLAYGIDEILSEIYERNAEEWTASRRAA